jgi:hypothetical protein
VPLYVWNHSLSTAIEPFERVIDIAILANATPVSLALCWRTQQLSGPSTDTNLCDTVQRVVSEELGGGGGEEADGTDVDGDVGDEPPPQAVTISATASIKSRSVIFFFQVPRSTGPSEGSSWRPDLAHGLEPSNDAALDVR